MAWVCSCGALVADIVEHQAVTCHVGYRPLGYRIPHPRPSAPARDTPTSGRRRKRSPSSRNSLKASLKAKVKRRDKRRCVDCGATENLTVDHIVPRSKGGTNRMRNLQTLCADCNQRKADALPAGALA